MQEPQNIECFHSPLLNNNIINSIEYDNLSSNISDLANKNKNKSEGIENSLISIKETISKNNLRLCF